MIRVKIFTGLALFLFVITVSSLFAASYIQKRSHDAVSKNIGSGSSQESASGDPSKNPSAVAYLDLEEVSKHNTVKDCYLIIDAGVYDVTGFLLAHPGGGSTIIPYCGKDATTAFATKEVSPKRDHSQMAKNLLDSYFVGRLGQQIAIDSAVSASAVPTATPSVTKATLIPTVAPAVTTNSKITLTSDEVLKHNSVSNCWLIISGKIYDVTKYLIQHPGGVGAISKYCGHDGSQGFVTKDTGSSHSAYANSLLSSYVIGTLGQAVPVSITTNPPTPAPTALPTTPTQTAVPSAQQLTLTQSEIATHNSLSNCWLIIAGKVYEVTRYLSQHPGGANVIAQYCGQDGSSAFQTKGGRGSNHSNSAYNLLANYLIGTVGSSVSITPTQTQIPSTGGSSVGLPSAITTKYPEATKRSGEYEDNGSWEGKVNTNFGCREVKVSSSGAITKDSSC